MKNIENISKNSFLKKIKILIFVLLISTMSTFIWQNKHKLQFNNIIFWLENVFCALGNGDGFPYEFKNGSILSEKTLLNNSNLILLTDRSLIYLNNSAKEISVKPHGFSEPFTKSNGIKTLFYNAQTNDYKIEIYSKNLYSGKTKNKILNGDISESGVYGFVMESKLYLAELIIFNNKNEEIYKYCFSEHFIVDIAISNNGKEAIVCGVSAKNGEINSTIYLLNFNSETPKKTFEFDGVTLYEAKYFSNGHIGVIGDKGIYTINTWFHSKNEFLFNEKYLNCFCFNKNEGITVCLSVFENSADCEIIFINKSGDVKGKFKTGRKIELIAQKNDIIAAVSNDNIFIYKFSGILEKSKKIPKGAKKIIMQSTSTVYLVGNRKIEKLNL